MTTTVMCSTLRNIRCVGVRQNYHLRSEHKTMRSWHDKDWHALQAESERRSLHKSPIILTRESPKRPSADHHRRALSGAA